MFVYSDVADYTYVEKITATILRIVSYKQSRSSTQSHQEFVNLHCIPLAKSYIDQVYIDIKDEIGRSVPFVGGKTLVKLNFKHMKVIKRAKIRNRYNQVPHLTQDTMGK